MTVWGANGNIFTGNRIGTNAAGTAALPNGGAGIYLGNGSSNNRIGTNGDGINDAAEGNIISGNTYDGIDLYGTGTNGNIIAGNRIGTDTAGTTALPNATGVYIIGGAQSNRVGVNGGDAGAAAEANLISGNSYSGVGIYGSGTNSNIVAGNLIGTDPGGTTAVPNQSGVAIGDQAQSNLIGTNADGSGDALERNVLSGNTYQGIFIGDSGTMQNVVAGNYIGVDSSGTAALANGSDGITIANGASANRIGTNGDGTHDAAERNVIAANTYAGVSIGDTGSDNNVIAGNYIGLDAGGAAMGNLANGVYISNGAQSNRIGTNGDNVNDAAERNVISDNAFDGVQIDGSGTSGNIVAGNYIGTDVSGTVPMGNQNHGVFLSNGAQSNRIGIHAGDAGAGNEANVISGNHWGGVALDDANTSNNVVAGNTIGMDAARTVALGNANYGVEIGNGASQNLIGGATAALGNLIAYNGWNGIRVWDNASIDNTIRANSIYGNDTPQVDLNFDGPTTNDNGDADIGPNNLQNYPLITSASAGASTTIAGTLNSAASTTYTFDFYASATPDVAYFGPGSPSQYLGSTTVTTNASGTVTFSVTLASSTFTGQWVYATATDPAGNTSEYSQSRQLPTVPVTLSATTWANIGPGPISDNNSNGPVVSGRVNVALADPTNSNVMLIATDGGGIFKTTDWNSPQPTWTPLTDTQSSLNFDVGYNTLVRAPSNSQILYGAVTGPGAGILKSTDGGGTWTLLANSTFENATMSSIVISPSDPNTLYVAVWWNYDGAGGGVYKSTNGGTSWTNITSAIHNGPVSDIVMDPTNCAGAVRRHGAGRSSATNGIWKSTNGGTSWTQLSGGLLAGSTIGDSIRLAIAPSAPSTVYATLWDTSMGNGTSGLPHRFCTTNSGASWTSLNEPMNNGNPDRESRYWHAVLSVDPTNANILYVNGDHTLYQSIDGGSTWTFLYDEDPVNVSFDDAGGVVMVGDRGIYRWTGSGQVFDNKHGNLADAEMYTIAVDPTDAGTVYGVSQDQFAILKYSGQPVWQLAGDGQEVGRVLVDPNNPSRLYAYTPGTDEAGSTAGTFVIRSDDGGASWVEKASEIPTTLAGFDLAYGNQHRAFVMDPGNASRLLLGIDQVWESTDSADTWTAISPVLSSGSIITALGIARSASGTIYAGTQDGKIFVTTTDGSGGWTNRTSGLSLGATTTSSTSRSIRPTRIMPTLRSVLNARAIPTTSRSSSQATPG